MKFCSQCGNPVSEEIPEGDNRERFVCSNCNTIHYQNPRIIAGCLALHEDKVLLCKRSIEPRLGKWTLPGGFLENGETIEEGALREMQEEANANATILDIYTMFSLPHISQVYMFFRAQLTDLNFFPGHESEDVRLFGEDEIPWDELAFPVIHDTLKFYLADRVNDHYPVRIRDIRYKPRPKS
jgi:ADP-ribose pyrophosphatase YjhB (NUDIX family)